MGAFAANAAAEAGQSEEEIMRTPRNMQEAFGTRGEKLHVEDEPSDPHKVMMILAVVNGVAMLLYFIFEVVR